MRVSFEKKVPLPAEPLLRVLVSLLVLFVSGAVGGACGRQGTPRSALREYARAMQEGDTDRSYAMMSAAFRGRVSRDEFSALLKENTKEAEQTAERLSSETVQIDIRANFDFGLDEHMEMVKESGSWRVASNPLDFYSQKTPRDAVRSFIRAYHLKRWHVLLRFVPSAYRERMTVDIIRKQFEGPRKEAVAEMVENLQVNLKMPLSDTRKGNQAKIRYSAQYEVELVREEGLWKIKGI